MFSYIRIQYVFSTYYASGTMLGNGGTMTNATDNVPALMHRAWHIGRITDSKDRATYLALDSGMATLCNHGKGLDLPENVCLIYKMRIPIS